MGYSAFDVPGDNPHPEPFHFNPGTYTNSVCCNNVSKRRNAASLFLERFLQTSH